MWSDVNFNVIDFGRLVCVNVIFGTYFWSSFYEWDTLELVTAKNLVQMQIFLV